MLSRRIGHICLVSIIVAAVGNAYLLNFGELMRIAAIAVGLGAYYWFHLRTLPCESSAVPRQMVSILALISVFLFVQFDPAYSGINRTIPQNFANWYAIATSILTIVAFASVILDARRWKEAGGESLAAQFSRWDWSVFSASAMGLVLIGVTSFKAEVPSGPALFSGAKLVLGASLYAATIGIYRRRVFSPTTQDKTDDSRKWVTTWRVLAGAFLAVLLIGVGKGLYARVQLQNGTDLLQRGLYAEAMPILESALELSGGRSEECQIALAEALFGLDEITAAWAQITSARHLYVGSQTIEKRIGDALSRTGHWDWAIYEYRTEGNKRGELYVFDELARAYLADGQFRELTEMIERQDRAPVVNLDSTADRVRLAICLTEAGKFADARRELNDATAHSSANWLIEYGKGVLANRTQDWKNGVEFLRRAVELEPQQLEPRLELGEALIELDEFDAAREQAVHVLARDPDRILALGQLASVHTAHFEMDRATDLVRRMTLHVGATQWQGPQKGGLGAAGACWYDFELYPGVLSISIKASGTQAVGVWPLMIVSLDQEEIASVTVDRLDTYKFQTRVEKVGNYRLSVFFPNDSTADQPGDRNLFIDVATLQYLSINR